MQISNIMHVKWFYKWERIFKMLKSRSISLDLRTTQPYIRIAIKCRNVFVKLFKMKLTLLIRNHRNHFPRFFFYVVICDQEFSFSWSNPGISLSGHPQGPGQGPGILVLDVIYHCKLPAPRSNGSILPQWNDTKNPGSNPLSLDFFY